MTTLGLFSGVVRDALACYATTVPPNPTQFYRANQPRIGLYDSASDAGSPALASGVMTSVPVFLAAGDVITNISFTSGATAAGTPTNYWFGLYSNASTPVLLAQTADQTSTAWGAFTTKTLALATAQTVTKTDVYWVAVAMAATTVPTLLGSIGVPPIVTGERRLSQSSGSALTATAPATIATPTVKNFAPYVVLT
ncbi:MAG: hypothetical protein JWO67_2573 [Streptosporangiaceae bacterium]|nr:hypothetical protein [Streptosporangiaceae bacterium]